MAGLLPVVGYEVPLPATNGGCRGMADVVDALFSLQKTCDDVLGNINTRVEKLREKYDDLSERAKDCKERVDGLKGIKRAVVVLSAPQLPKDIEQAETSGLHANNVKRRRQALQKKVAQMPLPFRAPIDVNVDGRTTADDNKRAGTTRPFDPAEKFEFNLLMPPRNNEQLSRAAERGLGRLPRQLESITSLLLFNTRENVYREYNDINVFALMRAERNDAVARRKPDGTFREDFSMRVGADQYTFRPEMDEGHDLLADLADDLPLDAAIPMGWDEQMADPNDTIAPTGQKNRGAGGKRRKGGDDDDADTAGGANLRVSSPTSAGLPKPMTAPQNLHAAPPMSPSGMPPPPGLGSIPAPPNMVAPNRGGNMPLPPGFASLPGSNAPPPPMMMGGASSMPNPNAMGLPPSTMPGMPSSSAIPPPPTAASTLPKAPGGGAMHNALMAAIRGAGGGTSLNAAPGGANTTTTTSAAAAKPAVQTAPAVKNKFAAAMEKRNRAIQGDMSDDDDDGPASPAPKPGAKASAQSAAAAAAAAAAARMNNNSNAGGVPPPPPPPGGASSPAKVNLPPPPVPPPKPPAPSAYVKSVKTAPDDDW